MSRTKRDLKWVRSLDWDVERREMVDDRIAELMTGRQTWHAIAEEIRSEAKQAKNDLAVEISEAVDAAVEDIDALTELLEITIPLYFERHKQLCALEGKGGAVDTAERSRVRALDRSLRGSHPVKTPRYREIARLADMKVDRVRYLIVGPSRKP